MDTQELSPNLKENNGNNNREEATHLKQDTKKMLQLLQLPPHFIKQLADKASFITRSNGRVINLKWVQNLSMLQKKEQVMKKLERQD